MRVRSTAAEPGSEGGEDPVSAGSWLPVRYRDFYDLPRLVAVEYRGRAYLFDSPFDDEVDDYADCYTVYRLPENLVGRLDDSSWEGLLSDAEEVGRVSLADVEFDVTKRERMNDSVFRQLDIS